MLFLCTWTHWDTHYASRLWKRLTRRQGSVGVTSLEIRRFDKMGCKFLFLGVAPTGQLRRVGLSAGVICIAVQIGLQLDRYRL